MAQKMIFLRILNHHVLLILLIYFGTRIIFLTSIPIFNDESIYLDWGWRELHYRGNLFYSLFYGNQPLLMWVFGIAQSFFEDPLFAGRLVSVFSGALSLLGIIYLGKTFFHKIVVYQAALLYIVSPLFSFFDRQVLMESSISAAGIWSCYFFAKMQETQRLKYAILLGLTLGVGFFIKSTTLIFAYVFIVISITTFLFKKNKKNICIQLLVSLFFFVIVNYPLFSQPLFWEGFTSLAKTRALTLQEVITFPLEQWLINTRDVLELSFWHLTPIVFLLGMMGIVITLFKQRSEVKRILSWFILCILLVILLARSLSPRYIEPFLPLYILFLSYFIFTIRNLSRRFSFLLFLLCTVSSFFMTAHQIIYPIDYFNSLSKVTKFSQKSEYVTNWPSGYGVSEACKFLSDKSNGNKKLYVVVRSDSGNPENAIFTCFNKSGLVKVSYLDVQKLITKINDKDCSKDIDEPWIPDYFISRDNQLASLNSLLEEEVRYYKPEHNSYIGVYKILSNCKSNLSQT